MLCKERTKCSAGPREMFAVVTICASFAAVAHGQSFTCPQVEVQDNTTHNCVVGNCKGTFVLDGCDTADKTSSFQCITAHPTCCGQPQVGFWSATEGGDCPGGCSSNVPLQQLLLREPPLISSAPATKQRSIRVRSSAGDQAGLVDSASTKGEKEVR